MSLCAAVTILPSSPSLFSHALTAAFKLGLSLLLHSLLPLEHHRAIAAAAAAAADVISSGERGLQVWMPELQRDLMHFPRRHNPVYSALSPPYLFVAFTKARRPCLKGAGDCLSLIFPTIWWPLLEGLFSPIRGLFLFIRVTCMKVQLPLAFLHSQVLLSRLRNDKFF